MPEQLIELGIANLHKAETAEVLAGLLDRLLDLAAEAAEGVSGPKARRFQSQLKGCRAQLAEAADREAARAVAIGCVDACESFLQEARGLLQAREKEFGEVIQVLSEAVQKIAGDSSAFHTRLAGSEQRFQQLAEIEDIRELKQNIVEEVSRLHQLVEEKRKQDEALCVSLSQRIERLHGELSEAKEKAALDPLTGVANRGCFDQEIRRWAESHTETRQPFVLAMIDVDNFKEINDTHGHPIGDRVLVTLVEHLSACTRSSDLLARYGGDEFALLLGDVNAPAAKPHLSELLEKISATGYQYTAGGETGMVGMSVTCGLAEFSFGESAEELLRRADEALYEAKKRGKNRVVARQKSILGALLGGSSKKKSA